MNARISFTSSRAAGIALVVGAALAIALAGCSVTRPSPVKNMFLLEPPPPAAPVAKTQPGTLRIDAFNVASPYRGRSFVFRQTNLQFESDFYNEFIVSPAANIADATARGLQQARVFEQVLAQGAPVDADWLLEGFVSSLYGDNRDAMKPAAEVSISFFLSKADSGRGVPFWSKQYAKRTAYSGSSAAAYAAAVNTAVGEIIAELARDLSAAQLPAK
jgi:ABC-type uncharacterized transport system auxiliary subunit